MLILKLKHFILNTGFKLFFIKVIQVGFSTEFGSFTFLYWNGELILKISGIKKTYIKSINFFRKVQPHSGGILSSTYVFLNFFTFLIEGFISMILYVDKSVRNSS